MKKQRTTDHRIPLSRGGTNVLENLVACCKDCNQRKDNMTDVEFLSLLESERAHQLDTLILPSRITLHEKSYPHL